MTQEEKSLLLKDLCARLPYGVKVQPSGSASPHKFVGYDKGLARIDIDQRFELENIKPYLRPMSSMTEEEKHKLLKFGAITCLENGEVIDVSCVGFERHADVQDYLNTCHFDYRGLIEKGLAIEVTKENNPNKYRDELDWLKSIKDRVKPQSKQEWSEEDEINLEKAIWYVENPAPMVVNDSMLVEWLKSIKDRVGNFDDGYKVGFSAAKHNQWKPSDRELGAILAAIGDERQKGSDVTKELLNIYQQLKKLREE